MHEFHEPSAAAVPGDLGWHLGMVLRRYQTEFEAVVAGVPGGIRGFQVLSTVVHRDPPNQQAIGAHLAVDRTVLTYLLDKLAADGLVDRTPDPLDRRAKKVVATPEGREVLADTEVKVAALEHDLLSVLGQQARTLQALLSQVSMHVHRSEPGTSPCAAIDGLLNPQV